jgi:MULE transposase domain
MYCYSSGLANNTLAAAIMPSYPSVCSTMQRDRRANLPPLPARRQELQIEMPFKTTSAGDRFLLSCGPNNDYIIFATDDDLSRLCASPVVCVDGTFDVAPSLFVQLYTFHAFVGDRLMPMVYVLMSQKSTEMYISMFAELKRQCSGRGFQFQPNEIMSDFESGVIPAVSQEFPAARHNGCFFHFCQVRNR